MAIQGFLLKTLLLITLLTLARSQEPRPTPGAPTLLETLTPNFFPINEAARALFPLSTRAFQTPLIVRYVYLYSLGFYEIAAACNSRALSFFGVRDSVDRALCKPLPRLKIVHYIVNALFRRHFSAEGAVHAKWLRSVGLTPDDETTDTSTEVGWANFVAKRANKYLDTDGWNSLGDLSRTSFRQPYSDYTTYKPTNLAGKPVSNLRRPLRWQPLTQSAGPPGDLRSQVHVVPHLPAVKPLALSASDIKSRKAQSPYAQPNKRNKLSKADRARMEKFIKKYFRISRKLTVEQRFLAFFWENKLLSLGFFLPYYSQLLNVDQFDMDTWFMSEMIAQHDALIVAWKEKIRNDLVRPTTIIRKLWRGRFVRALVGLDGGVQKVRADEYEPLIPIQPHSEFPSASAVLCGASLENLDLALRGRFGNNMTLPRFVLPVRKESFTLLPVLGNFDLVYNNLQEAIESCGQSRLWAGVHFEPSVSEGLRIAKGIGARAIAQMTALAEGRVPTNCARCL